MTLNDLVTYNHKHNVANGEDNRDGTDANWSFNSGFEGMTSDINVKENRLKRIRAMLATELLSFGTPILRSGDEFLNTQFGNNNAYCQDNVISYMVWDAIGAEDIDNIRYTKKLIKLRNKMGVFSYRNFFNGGIIDSKQGVKDLSWWTERGVEFTQNDWYQYNRKSLSYLVSGKDRLYLVIFNANNNNIKWKLPNIKKTYKWSLLLDSSEMFEDNGIGSGVEIWVPGWSVLCFEVKK
jgi:glycogen operon protein